ncbi:MAG: hypothetical protein JXA42_18415, partial [Anaerolineales bacterium]|nr:hypothetical protein [Anaerolineales bacterium]
MEKNKLRQSEKEQKRQNRKPSAARLIRLVILLAVLPASFQFVFAATNPLEVQQSTGYWHLLEVVTNEAYLPGVERGIISANASVSEGSSSYSVSYSEGYQHVGDCTWSLDAPNGLDKLAPGEMLQGRLSMTDQSQYLRTSDGYDHGYAGGNGSIYIDKPYLGTSYTAAYRALLNLTVGYQESVSIEGQLAVPDGAGWDGKMGLKVVCLGSVYERVYEWAPPDSAGEITPEIITGVDDETSASTPEGDGLSWIVVVGGIAAVGAAALAAIAAAGVGAAVIIRRGKNKAPQKQSPPSKYILQLSEKTLQVLVGQSAPLTIQAWRITPDGGTVPAPEAAIQISLPHSPAGLVVTPAAGQGTLVCAFSTINPTQCAQV